MKRTRLVLGLGLAVSSSSCLFPSGQPVSSVLSTAQLEKLIVDHDLRTPEEVLQRIPDEAKKDYALIYRSNSPQAADFLRPRVVMFGPKAEFLLAFNDGSILPAAPVNWDILEFNPEKKVYEARTIEFAAGGSAAPVVNRAPTSCVSCHLSGLGVQPIRRVYLGSVFPGVYGSVVDRFSPAEGRHFRQFLSQRESRGIYRHLPDQNPQPNARLGTLLNRRHFEGLAQALASKPELKPFRYAMLAALECTKRDSDRPIADWDSDIQNYVPESARQGFKTSLQKTLSDFRQAQQVRFEEAVLLRDFHLGASDLSPRAFSTLAPPQEETSASFIYVVGNVVGDPVVADLLKELTTIGRDRMGDLGTLAKPLYPLLLDPAEDPGLLRLHEAFSARHPEDLDPFEIASEHGKDLCATLKSRSLEALAGWSPPPPATPE